MAVARTLIVVPQRPRKASKIHIQRRLADALWRYLAGALATLPERGATLGDLPPEYFRFPPF